MTWEFAVRLAKACLAASLASALIAGIFAACTSSQVKQRDAEQSSQMEEYKDSSNGKVTVYTDKDTGVQYLIFESDRRGGITPRLDENGNAMVQKGNTDEE